MKTQLSAFFVGLLLAHSVLADDADPPSLVGRVSFIQGNAGLQAGETAAEQVQLNRPVTIGDRVRTEDHALVELSLGTAAIRLDENTDVTVANLDDDITQLQLDGGTMSLHVFELKPNENIEIDTPTATVRVLEPGDYRIDADSDGSTRVAVRHGNAELDGGGGPVRVRDQQQLVFAGTDEPVNVIAMAAPDDFDQWGMSRDRHFEDSQSAKYVSREVVGYEDLDANGSWNSEPDYGEVWYPNRIAADWAPYRDGRWVWVQPWGWSWVDDAPWGFAPFHYGRWAYVRSRWGWVPGPRTIRPVYAPALVGWDGRPGVSFTISTRPTRWFPLGPREVYVPAHRVSSRYLRNVNVSNTVIINNAQITNVYQNRARDVRYVNRSAPNALTTREHLARFDRRAPQARPLPPRTSFARGVAQREGLPVVSRPAQPFRGRPGEVDRARDGQRDNLGAGRLQPRVEPAAPVSGPSANQGQGARFGDRRGNERNDSNDLSGNDRQTQQLREQLQERQQQQQLDQRRAVGQQRDQAQQLQQAQRAQQQQAERTQQQERVQQQVQAQQQAQAQQREQLQRRELSDRRQDQVQRQQEQSQRQQQQIQEQAQRQHQAQSQQFQRQQEARQQQDQFRAQQAQRQNQERQQQMQRAQQVQQQQSQARAQDSQRQARDAASAPRATERREDPRRAGRDERQQLR